MARQEVVALNPEVFALGYRFCTLPRSGSRVGDDGRVGVGRKRWREQRYGDRIRCQ